MNRLNTLRRYLGLLWMVLGPAAIIAMVISALRNIDPSRKGEIHQPLPWIIIIAVFIPIAIGLTIFGWYAWKGEYERENVEQSNRE
jgi:purine-cytosine permease-like protein